MNIKQIRADTESIGPVHVIQDFDVEKACFYERARTELIPNLCNRVEELEAVIELLTKGKRKR